jgi:hypothetical protein
VIAGAIQVNSGGTLTGGSDPNLSPTGIVNARGPVTMTSGSTYSLLMNGNTPGGGTTSHDQLDLTGGGSISIGNAFLQTGLGYAPAPTDTINFIVGGPVTGIFSGRPDNSSFFVGTFGGQNYAATIHYTTNSVFLNNFSPVPEPLHILAIGGLTVGGFGWWKKRRKA